jgi:hypothetical protein
MYPSKTRIRHQSKSRKNNNANHGDEKEKSIPLALFNTMIKEETMVESQKEHWQFWT